jgi:hypothetical protein
VVVQQYGSLYVYAGDFDLNGNNLTTTYLNIFATYGDVSVDLGEGIVNMQLEDDDQSLYISDDDDYTVTIVPATSTINFNFPSGGSTTNTAVVEIENSTSLDLYDVNIVGTGDGSEVFRLKSWVGSGGELPTLTTLNTHTFTISGNPITVDLALFTYNGAYGTCTLHCDTFVANGTVGNLITLLNSLYSQTKFRSYVHSTNAASVSYIDVKDNYALGDIPFDASTGGVDSGNNVNWYFGQADFVPRITVI